MQLQLYVCFRNMPVSQVRRIVLIFMPSSIIAPWEVTGTPVSLGNGVMVKTKLPIFYLYWCADASPQHTACLCWVCRFEILRIAWHQCVLANTLRESQAFYLAFSSEPNSDISHCRISTAPSGPDLLKPLACMQTILCRLSYSSARAQQFSRIHWLSRSST